MSDRLTIQAPAKLNLGLRVLGRRPDGYHEIETLFIAVTLYDVLYFEKPESGGIALTWEPGRPDFHVGNFQADDSNLIVLAARLFERRAGHPLNVSIHLKKSIPVAAGLGGGSSDAAATLVALNRLFPDCVSADQLAAIASELGSDIPFFLGPPASIGRGRGEVLTPIDLNRTWWAILICPNVPSPTREVYSALPLTYSGEIGDFPVRLDGDGFFAALRLFHNDLQDVVIGRIPEVAVWLKRLRELGAEGAYVSGSGPSVFGIFRMRPGPAIIASLQGDGVAVFEVRPVHTPMSMVIESS